MHVGRLPFRNANALFHRPASKSIADHCICRTSPPRCAVNSRSLNCSPRAGALAVNSSSHTRHRRLIGPVHVAHPLAGGLGALDAGRRVVLDRLMPCEMPNRNRRDTTARTWSDKAGGVARRISDAIEQLRHVLPLDVAHWPSVPVRPAVPGRSSRRPASKTSSELTVALDVGRKVLNRTTGAASTSGSSRLVRTCLRAAARSSSG